MISDYNRESGFTGDDKGRFRSLDCRHASDPGVGGTPQEVQSCQSVKNLTISLSFPFRPSLLSSQYLLFAFDNQLSSIENGQLW
jgi:hypothetical protein